MSADYYMQLVKDLQARVDAVAYVSGQLHSTVNGAYSISDADRLAQVRERLRDLDRVLGLPVIADGAEGGERA